MGAFNPTKSPSKLALISAEVSAPTRVMMVLRKKQGLQEVPNAKPFGEKDADNQVFP